MTTTLKGMICNVYRDASGTDCTLGGITSRHHSVLLTGDNVPELFREDDNHPAVRLHKRNVGGRDYFYALPMDATGNGTGTYMFGGNFIYTSDSRFPTNHPLPVHDRAVSKERH
jgi:hypothetical protein